MRQWELMDGCIAAGGSRGHLLKFSMALGRGICACLNGHWMKTTKRNMDELCSVS
jgi:hypothetical protein